MWGLVESETVTGEMSFNHLGDGVMESKTENALSGGGHGEVKSLLECFAYNSIESIQILFSKLR